MSQENKITIKDFSFYYNSVQALLNINLDIRSREIFAIFGPARSGKTTLLKSLNRLTDLILGTRHTGMILLDGIDIYDLNHLKLMTTGDVNVSEMDFVEPFQTGQIQGSFPIDLEVGEYWADIYTYKEENQSQAGEAYKVFFKIVPPGTLKQLSQKGLSESDYKLGLITILMVAVILTWINKDKIKAAFKRK